MRGTTIASWAQLIARALERRDVDVDRLFCEAGLDPALLANSCARYPVAGMQRLWSLAMEASGDPDFGLEAADCWTPTVWHALGYAWLASSTLRDAFGRAARYSRLVSDAVEVTLVPVEDGGRLEARTRAANSMERASQDAVLATLLRMARLTRGESFHPVAICVRYPRPRRTERLEAVFKAPITFDAPSIGFEVSNDDLDASLITSNAELARANDQVVVEYLARSDRRNRSFAVRTRLLEQLSSGKACEESVARSLNTTPRTLQRRLRDEGTSYQKLLTEVRRELAKEYMDQADLSISEITYLLGFSEPSNFTRAFKRWTGATPSEYRDRMHTDAARSTG